MSEAETGGRQLEAKGHHQKLEDAREYSFYPDSTQSLRGSPAPPIL